MKVRLLDFGTITADLGWAIDAGGVSTHSNQSPDTLRRDFQILGALIEHPKHGVILYDIGPAPNWKDLWPDPVKEVFAITRHEEENRLDKQLEKAGYTLKDVSCIIISHLHLDHAGGLECFRGIDVPVYAHEEEIKYAFYAIATKQDFGAYLPYYIDPAFNWKAVHGEEFEIFEGITLYQTQGHTPGTMSMKVALNGSESFLFTTDTMLFKENYYDEQPLGWLIRDVSEWWRSLAKLKSIATRYNSHVILGHDEEVFAEYTKKPFYES